MNHLSTEDISKVIAGWNITSEDHLRECESCTAKVSQAQETFLRFGSQVREWTSCPPTPLAQLAPVRSRFRPVFAWALAATAAVALVSVPAYHDIRERQVREQAERDAALMDNVARDLSSDSD